MQLPSFAACTLLLLLLYSCAAAASGTRNSVGKKTVPTVVRRSTTMEGTVCLHVFRHSNGARHSVGRPFPQGRLFRRNTAAKYQVSGTDTPASYQGPSLRRNYSEDSEGGILKLSSSNRPGSKDAHADVVEKTKIYQEQKSNKTVLRSLPNSSQVKAAVIQEDELYHLPVLRVPVDADYDIGDDVETSGQSRLQGMVVLPHGRAGDQSSLPEREQSFFPPGSPDHGHRRSLHPLLRPLGPSDARRVVHLRRPMVVVSLMVIEREGGMQFMAGEAAVDPRLLSDGVHSLTFSQVVEDQQHKLRVTVDGVESSFVSSGVRRYTAHQYRPYEVKIKIQGPVQFVGSNSSCQDAVTHPTGLSPTQEDGSLDAHDTSSDYHTEEFSHDVSEEPSHAPRDVYNNVILRNRTVLHAIVVNSTVYDSELSFSFINSSTVYNSVIDNSLVIFGTIVNSTLIDSRLQNVSMTNCTQHTTDTFISSRLNTTVSFDPSYSEEKFENSSGNHHQVVTHQEVVDSLSSASSDDLNAIMLTFGVIGLVVLMVVVVVVVILIARRVKKKKDDMLLVRSAVMGNVKSW